MEREIKKRKFNVTAQCVPDKHYMVDTTAKIEQIVDMIDEELYFTINRARQYGKTTTISLLRSWLSEKYIAVKISFEGTGDTLFETEKSFCKMFLAILTRALEASGYGNENLSVLKNQYPENMDELGVTITDFVNGASKPVVLMIDEVDKASNNQVFLMFLGMLRNKYILRQDGMDVTFHSVILAGVYDVKNLKFKIKGTSQSTDIEGGKYNSPWNIATDFLVDMSFNPAEIATMLVDYENDHHTGMDIDAISGMLYRYTSGYPFLVSKLCKIIDERLDKNWTLDGVEQAVKIILDEDNTLFEDLFKNIENNKDLYNLIFAVMIEGSEVPFSSDNPAIGLGKRFGIFSTKDRKVAISNEIFELRISNYLASKIALTSAATKFVLKEDIVQNGIFNMRLCLEKFAVHFYEMYDRNDTDFFGKHGRLLFMTYLKPLINGQGFYHIETQTRNTRRMDLVVDYGKQQFVVELKLWRGEKLHEDAYGQLWEYLDAKGFEEGYLLTFDFRKKENRREAEWVEYCGKKIFDVLV